MEPLLSWVEQNPAYAQLLIIGLACFEAVVGIGLFISGAVLLSVASFLYTQGLLGMQEILPLAFIGALVGDQSGFWIGRKLGPSFHATAFAQQHRGRIEQAEGMIRRFGAGAVFIGRLMTGIRSIVPLITGMSGYNPLRYLVFDLLAVTVWVAGLWALILGMEKIFTG